ncbi:MAG: hypothetical protein SynsKO_39240 [Synoicihabitans sp.]
MAITVTQFKAHCLRVVDEVQTTKRSVVISRHGRAAAKLVPVDREESLSWQGRARRTTKTVGDLISTGEEWDAES